MGILMADDVIQSFVTLRTAIQIYKQLSRKLYTQLNA